MRELLNLPERSAKPRDRGVTHVIDRGLSIAEIEGMIEVGGEFVDIVKLGWGTALGFSLSEFATTTASRRSAGAM